MQSFAAVRWTARAPWRWRFTDRRTRGQYGTNLVELLPTRDSGRGQCALVRHAEGLYMLLRFQKAAVRGNYETGNQAFSKRLRFLTIRDGIPLGSLNGRTNTELYRATAA